MNIFGGAILEDIGPTGLADSATSIEIVRRRIHRPKKKEMKK